MRLASDLYNLAAPGGPYYPPPTVQRAATAALDSLFPTGQGTRRLLRLVFRALYPLDWWAAQYWSAPLRWLSRAYARLLQAALAFAAWLVAALHAAVQRRRVQRRL